MLIAADQDYISKKDLEDFRVPTRQFSAGLSNLARYLRESKAKSTQP
jgi:hypothetical protein